MGSSMVMPSFSSLASRYVPDDRQGFALGCSGASAPGQVLGPIAGGVLYFGLGSIAPYGAAAVVLLAPLAITRGLRGSGFTQRPEGR